MSARVSVPTYERAALEPGIVHIGVGGFHRAHQAMYLDRLAERDPRGAWGIVGVSLRRPAVRDALVRQDCLYTVVERAESGDRARVVGSLTRCLFAPEDPSAVLDALTDPRTRIVTLTITGGGYNVDPHTLRFDDADPAVADDLARPHAPSTFFGYVVEALDRRRRHGIAPFTVLSCDNLPSNGPVARAAVVSFAALRDEVLARWIDDNVTFPSSMVDRITPETTDADRRYVSDAFGLRDRAPVIAEPFTQWIVEDRFCNGRPPLEQVGVQFVDDVEPYKLMKTRLLNASHSAIGYLGYLSGHRSTDEAIGDPALREYLARLMDDEVTPLLPRVPGIDLDDYKRTLLGRLANPKVGDRLTRLCGRGSVKMPSYLLPSIAEARARRQPHDLLTLAVAGWLRYLRGVDYAGERIEVKDVMSDTLCPLAARGGSDPRPILRGTDVFGRLGSDREFAASLEHALRDLDRDGPAGAVQARLGRRPLEAVAA